MSSDHPPLVRKSRTQNTTLLEHRLYNAVFYLYTQVRLLFSGPKGSTGVQGATGMTGPKGRTGVIGYTGETGPQGETGVDGTVAIAGPTGWWGPRGPRGVRGPTGTMCSLTPFFCHMDRCVWIKRDDDDDDDFHYFRYIIIQTHEI